MRIELNSVSIRYGRVHALDNVSLVIEPGQIVAVLGPNGAGKTTLLRSLAGIVAPSGDILCDGEPFSRGVMSLRRRMAFLPDFPPAFGRMTVLRHIGMVVKLYEVDAAAAEPRTMELLRGFDLLPLIDTPMSNLSRGQLYKCALTALLAVDPEVLMLDEPFASGMDPSGISYLKRLLRDVAARGSTVLYTTQILDIAEKVSDRLCVIDRGALRYFAPPSGDVGELDQLFASLRESAQ